VFGARLTQEPAVVLLVKPQATRPPEATFFLKRNGVLSTVPNGEVFVFRRKELGGGRPTRRPRQDDPALDLLADGNGAAGEIAPLQGVDPAVEIPKDLAVPSFGGLAPDIPSVETPAPQAKEARTRSTWIWIPLSFIFLLLGIVLGFQIALSFRPPKPVEPAPQGDPFVLGLSVSEFNSSLHLRWNAEAPAIRAGQKALLHIQDGDAAKSVSLDRNDLTRGGVLYRYSTGNVAFRLEIFTQEKSSVSESVDIRMLAPAEGAEAKQK
jgi:hypothetical protein